MLVWIQTLASATLLSTSSQTALTTIIGTNGTYGLGMGIETFEHWIGHHSYIVGYETQVFSRPNVGTIIVMTNLNTNLPTASAELFDAVRWAAFGSQ